MKPYIPCCDIEAEEKILGAALLTPAVIGTVFQVLNPTDFFHEIERRLWSGILHHHMNGADSLPKLVQGLQHMPYGDGPQTVIDIVGMHRLLHMVSVAVAPDQVKLLARYLKKVAALNRICPLEPGKAEPFALKQLTAAAFAFYQGAEFVGLHELGGVLHYVFRRQDPGALVQAYIDDCSVGVAGYAAALEQLLDAKSMPAPATPAPSPANAIN